MGKKLTSDSTSKPTEREFNLQFFAEDGDGDGEGDGSGEGDPGGNGGGNEDTVSREEYEQLKNELESVKSKNEELLDEVKTEREKRREEQKEKNIKEENIEELQEQLEQEKEEAVQAEREEKQMWKETAEKLLIDNELTDTLDEVGVAAPYKESLRHELRQNIEVVESEDGELPLEAVAKDGARKIGIDEFVQKTLEEKGEEHFVTAPNNNGGGAGSSRNGSGGGENSNPLDQASEDFSITDANEFVRDNDESTVKQKLKEAENPISVNV